MGLCETYIPNRFTLCYFCRSVSGTSISDHLHYYGVDLMGKTWRSCGIVMDSHVKKYSKADTKGNIVLSRDLVSPSLKLKTGTDGGIDNV